MGSVQCSVGRGKKAKRLSEVETVDRASYQGLEQDAKVELIRGLIPLGLPSDAPSRAHP
jgi:outer membrane receptor for ferrienterochelin and colicin